MPCNTVGIAGTRRELSANVVETVPPQKKIQKKNRRGFQNMFFTNFSFFFDMKFWIITALIAVTGTSKS